MQSTRHPALQNTALNTDQRTIHQIEKPGVEQSIGTLLVKSGKLDGAKVDRILKHQKLKHIRFGDAAVQLGLLSAEDVRMVLAQQYHYPYLKHGDGMMSDALIAAYQPFSQQVEGLRALRSKLTAHWFTTWPLRKRLAILSPGRGEGRSYLAANLAILFSQLGKRTLLIDADMRHSSQHSLFNLPNQLGLSSILSGRGDASSIQHLTPFNSLSVLTAGPIPPNPQELLGQKLFRSLMSYVGNEFDIVLVDTPSATTYADASIIATEAGGALIVTRQHHSSLQDTHQLTAGLMQLDVAMAGAVLNHF